MKYSLRGVATTSEVAYVCVRDAENPSNAGEGLVGTDQWWKIGYVKTDASPIKSEVRVYDIMDTTTLLIFNEESDTRRRLTSGWN